MIYVGTSGFSYREWKGVFYPDKLPAKDYLSFYAQHFSTTEINNTFYRSPSEETTRKWSAQVPQNFRFTLKLNQKITHKKRLRDVKEEMEWFLKGATALGSKLGTILVQLPPYLRENTSVLETFLKQYSDKVWLALEFRHPSWFSEETFQLLQDHQAALVVTESDQHPAVQTVTAPFIYIRLRRSNYSEEDLRQWARWIQAQKRDTFAYLKHDRDAPHLAERLIQFMDQSFL
ncbi:DUF72 domain-containing protein [Acidobacteria bacterium AH-259-D05]|nr:DUF72 domain-containing protein [Acidobacteria bacterium AH-259-D05]